MESRTINSFAGQIQALAERDKDFPGKLKQRLVCESIKMENPFKFIVGLFDEGVLCDGSSDPEDVFGYREIIVELAIAIACSKGVDAIGGLVRALKGSGNAQLISFLCTWIKKDYDIPTHDEFSESEAGASARQSPPAKMSRENVLSPTDLRYSGTKLMDKIMSHVDDDFMEQLQDHLVGKASQFVNISEFSARLIHLNMLEETDVQLATGPEVQQIEEAIKAACSKRVIGSLVLALQSSKNERVLEETDIWLETFQARNKLNPIAVKGLANQPGPATGLFAATSKGLISMDLRTLEATTVAPQETHAVAVNHKLNKVYWAENHGGSCIMRSNFDGSAKERIIPPAGDIIHALAIDEVSGNVCFSLWKSHDIKACNALGENCAVVISNPVLVNQLASIVLDSERSFMYCGNRKFSNPHSIVRANLDGSNATIISTGFTGLNGITLDQASTEVLYWADGKEHNIGSIDVNSGNKQTLLELKDYYSLPYAIQVDEHKIYFSSFYRRQIQSVDKHSGKNSTTILDSTGTVGNLALFNAPLEKPSTCFQLFTCSQ